MELKIPHISPFRRLLIVLGVTIFTLIIILVYSYKISHRLFEDFKWVEHTYKVAAQIESMTLMLTRQESMTRAYIITGNKDLIKDFSKHLEQIRKEFYRMEHLIQDNPGQIKRISILKTLFSQRIDKLQKCIRLKSAGGYSEQMMQSYILDGYKHMDKVNELKLELEEEEQKLLVLRRSDAYQNLNSTNSTILFAGAISIVSIILIVILIRNDIKRRDKLEREMKELDMNKNKFFSIVSHDLRGPIHGISKLAGFMKDEENTSREEMILMGRIMEDSAKKAGNLLENLLQWAQVQMNRLEFKPSGFYIDELVEECMDALRVNADIKKIALISNVQKQLVFADKNMINTVVRNLMSNAIKFTFEEGKVVVSSLRKNGHIEITVSDTGIGISDDAAKKLFHMDKANSTKGTANETGNGLGLLICKEFLEKNHGRIWVERRKEGGTDFTFTLRPIAS
jgi:signal transduction histidine kinase